MLIKTKFLRLTAAKSSVYAMNSEVGALNILGIMDLHFVLFWLYLLLKKKNEGGAFNEGENNDKNTKYWGATP